MQQSNNTSIIFVNELENNECINVHKNTTKLIQNNLFKKLFSFVFRKTAVGASVSFYIFSTVPRWKNIEVLERLFNNFLRSLNPKKIII